MAIDDEIDAARAAYPEQPKNLLKAALKLAAPFCEAAGLLDALEELFSVNSERQRVAALLAALERVIRRHEESIQDTSEKIKSPVFIETLLTAVNEAAHTTDLNKVERLARVLGNTLCQPAEKTDWEEAAAFIRDLEELTAEDIEALLILNQVLGDLATTYSNLQAPDQFAQRTKAVLQEVHRRGMNPDDFYSRCSRLTGFGLALQVAFIPTSMSPGEYCFRYTLRGRRLLSLLE